MNRLEIVELASSFIDLLGVAVVFLGVLWGLISFIKSFFSTRSQNAYKSFRLQIVKALLLGLEVLVAGDVIRTVAMPNPNLDGVVVLGAIVLIRCFLSWSLILEVEGRWPWQPANKPSELD